MSKPYLFPMGRREALALCDAGYLTVAEYARLVAEGAFGSPSADASEFTSLDGSISATAGEQSPASFIPSSGAARCEHPIRCGGCEPESNPGFGLRRINLTSPSGHGSDCVKGHAFRGPLSASGGGLGKGMTFKL